MGYSDGRKQMRRILSIIKRLQKSNGIRVRDLADFYDVDITRIYEDLKVIKDLYDLKRDRWDYWIGRSYIGHLRSILEILKFRRNYLYFLLTHEVR